MSSITTQIHSLAAEVKARFYQTMDQIHEESTTSSSGRVRLKAQLDKEEKSRQQLERQVINLRKSTQKSFDKAQKQRTKLSQTVDLVEARRGKNEDRVRSLEVEVDSLKQFTGMPELDNEGNLNNPQALA